MPHDPVLARRATEAATAVAADHGLRAASPVLLVSASNVLVHLRPAPVVARVMTATAVLHADPRAWLERELALGAYAAGRTRAVPPSAELPPGPHERDGMWITFWAYVAPVPAAAPAAHKLGTALRELHDALAGYPGELEPIAAIRGAIERLDPAPRLRAELDRLAPEVFERTAPGQPLHGDASLSNLLPSPDGLLWNDFEDTCRGPVEWDVASLVESARRRGLDEAELLRAYGPCADLEPFLAVQALYATAWQAHRARR
jgi:hypothetical protein